MQYVCEMKRFQTNQWKTRKANYFHAKEDTMTGANECCISKESQWERVVDEPVFGNQLLVFELQRKWLYDYVLQFFGSPANWPCDILK